MTIVSEDAIQSRKNRIESTKRHLIASNGIRRDVVFSEIALNLGVTPKKAREYLELLKSAQFFSIDEKTNCINCEKNIKGVDKYDGINQSGSQGMDSGRDSTGSKGKISIRE